MDTILHYFSVAGVRFKEGVLVIDSTGFSSSDKMYEVMVKPEGDGVVVTAYRPRFGMSLHKGHYPVNLITEDSSEEYKPWPWSKTKKRRSLEIVEFLERKLRTYHVKNYLVIQ